MQQPFRLLIFLIQPHVFRATNSPILGSTFWLQTQLLVKCTDTAADWCHGWDGTSVPSQLWHWSAAVSVHCTKSCVCSQKVLLRIGEFVARNMWGWIKKINKQKSCCILLVVYIVELHCGLTVKTDNFMQNYSSEAIVKFSTELWNRIFGFVILRCLFYRPD
jgi:hypothetical protein